MSEASSVRSEWIGFLAHGPLYCHCHIWKKRAVSVATIERFSCQSHQLEIIQWRLTKWSSKKRLVVLATTSKELTSPPPCGDLKREADPWHLHSTRDKRCAVLSHIFARLAKLTFVQAQRQQRKDPGVWDNRRPCKLNHWYGHRVQTGDSWGPSTRASFPRDRRIKPHLCTDSPLIPTMIVAHPSHSTHIKDWRRRSADVGGLHLATENSGQGQGWMGGHPGEIEYAIPLARIRLSANNRRRPELCLQRCWAICIPKRWILSTRTALKCVCLYSFFVHTSWHTAVTPPISLNLYDHASYTHWIVGILNPTDSLMKKSSPVLYYYSRLSSELKECERLFHLPCVSALSPTPPQYLHLSYSSVTEQISAFIHHLRRIYRYENSYHNFEHALDVLQAAQSYLKSEGMVPSPTILFEQTRMWKPKKQFDSGSLISTLGLRQLFILYIAAIGHDVGHPGFSNVFMVSCINFARNATSSLNSHLINPLEKRTDAPISCFQSSISVRELALSVAASSDEVPWFRRFIGQFLWWALPQEDTIAFGACHRYGCTPRLHAAI